MVQGKTLHSEVIPSDQDNFDKAAFDLWIPNGQHAIKLLLVILPGWNEDGQQLIYSEEWQSLARELDCALISCSFQGSLPKKAYDLTNEGSGDALLKAIDQFGVQLNQPELHGMPMMLCGHSAGGQYAYSFACHHPELTLGFVAIKGGFYEEATNNETRKVPGLFIGGELDSKYRIDNIKELVFTNRSIHAPWCVAIEPGAGHEVGKSLDLAIDFFKSIVPLRFDNKLHPIDITISWLGSLQTKRAYPYALFPGKKETGVWIPTENMALKWEQFE